MSRTLLQVNRTPSHSSGFRKTLFTSLALALLCLGTATAARADAVQLTGYSQLTPGFSTVTYTGAPNTVFTGGVTVSAGGNTVTITDANNVLERRDQGSGWAGNFAPGERLLWTQGGNNNPLTLTFANGISEFGLQAQSDTFGAETFTVQLFNGATLIRTLIISGTSTSGGNDTATFLGARATGGDVFTRILINNAGNSPGDFAFNEVSFNNAGTQPNPVPEPTTMLLLGTGLAGIAAKARRRRGSLASDEG